jgi:hypothetical protein
VPGTFTTIEPSPPNWKIPAAIVLNSKNNGTIVVRYTYIPNLNDLNDVDTTNPANNDLLLYNGISWNHTSISSIPFPIKTVSSNSVLTIQDGTVLVNALSGNINITLPSVSQYIGSKFNIKKIDISGHNVTIRANNVNIDGSNTVIITQQYTSLTFTSDGNQWWII